MPDKKRNASAIAGIVLLFIIIIGDIITGIGASHAPFHPNYGHSRASGLVQTTNSTATSTGFGILMIATLSGNFTVWGEQAGYTNSVNPVTQDMLWVYQSTMGIPPHNSAPTPGDIVLDEFFPAHYNGGFSFYNSYSTKSFPSVLHSGQKVYFYLAVGSDSGLVTLSITDNTINVLEIG